MAAFIDPAALRRKTAPQLLCERARATPDALAFRSKHLGIYRERSWRTYAALIAHAARAFQDLGLGRGERAAIMADAFEQWMICDLAAQLFTASIRPRPPPSSNIRCATAGP